MSIENMIVYKEEQLHTLLTKNMPDDVTFSYSKPMHRVLIRDKKTNVWMIAVYSSYINLNSNEDKMYAINYYMMQRLTDMMKTLQELDKLLVKKG